MATSRLKQYLTSQDPSKHDTAAIAFLAGLDHLYTSSPQIAFRIEKELEDQRHHLKMIASENYCSPAVQLAMGNWMTDKYSEGYPFHRFYAGCENVDHIEAEAVELLKELFGAEHAYVQPHSGADANLVAIWSALVTRLQNPALERLGAKNIDSLSPEDYETIRQSMVNAKIMGMSLNAGGHLTHGYRHNISAKMMRACHYDVNPETELLDYSQLAEQVKKEKPTILMAGYSAYPRKLNFAHFREIADSVGATLIVDMAHFSGLVAGKTLKGDHDPVPFAHLVTSTTHKTLRGPRGGIVLCKEEFSETVNKGCPLVLGGPLPHVIAAKAVAFREASQESFQQYAQKVLENAQALADGLQSRGVRLTTGGTENHLVICDVSSFGITGRQAELALTEVSLTCNRNAIPFDKNGPWYTSGIRLGTPALTSRGMGASEMDEIASIIVETLQATTPTTVAKTGKPSKAKYQLDETVLEGVKSRVSTLLSGHPLYPMLPSLSARAELEPA